MCGFQAHAACIGFTLQGLGCGMGVLVRPGSWSRCLHSGESWRDLAHGEPVLEWHQGGVLEELGSWRAGAYVAQV